MELVCGRTRNIAGDFLTIASSIPPKTPSGIPHDALSGMYIFFFFLGKPVFTSGITSLVPSGIPMKDVSEILRECLQKYLSRLHGIHSLPDGSDGRVSIVSIFGEIRSLPLKIPQGSFSEDPSSLLKFLSGALSGKFFSLRIVFFIP